MKPVLKLVTLILLTLTVQIPHSYAQDTVRTIYFYPNDSAPQAGINATLDTKMKNAQAFFADVMELYGYGRKTFDLDTDGNGNVLVDHVQGNFNDAYYHEDTFSKVLTELYDSYDTSQNIYFVAMDISPEVLDVNFRGTDVEACGIASGHWGATPAHGECFNFVVIAHELGHAFGLEHDATSSGNIDPMINSPCAAAWLDVHPYFNGGNTDAGSTTINMLSPRLAPEEGNVRFSFDVSDPDGLYLLRVFIYELDSVVSCKPLDGDNGTIIIDTSYIPQSDPSANLTIMDKNGNYTEYLFDLDTENLLNSINVHIPDPNLATIIREQTNLLSTAQITTQTLARLTSLELTDTSRPITNLKGLEQAINLETLVIRNQKRITDFSPLSDLTELRTLEISSSGFSDLSILSGLTNLQHLNLADNDIRDVSGLLVLTNLLTLDLRNNQIRDVSPLETLTNLEQLLVAGNPIPNPTPPRTMEEQNPNLEPNDDPEPNPTPPTDTETPPSNVTPPTEVTPPTVPPVDTETPIDPDPLTNADPTFIDGTSAVRWVLEKSPIGTNVGSPISATDIDNDTLTYIITGNRDTWVFEIDSNTGQLKTKVKMLYHQQNIYNVDVSVSDENGGSATISVTINVAQIGGDIIPELIPIHVSFSELMVTSRGGLHSLPQWMELYNGSQTEDVNLTGWLLAIEARDLNGTHRLGVISLKDLYIPPKETALIVTWNARQKSDLLSENRVYHFFRHHSDEFEQNQHRNMIIGLAGFSLKLINADGILVDIIGNLDGDPSTLDEPAWEIPVGPSEDGERASLMRRYTKDAFLPLDGTDADSWRSTANFPLVVSSYWGNATDIGNPGYRRNGTLPVTLSHFWAEHTEKGIVLTWTTESEIENAGFYILRSETKNGVFKVVTPKLIKGAGTTSKRNDYTWIDTTTKPNTHYFYRIVDVSFAGIRQQLATVSLRGLLSAKKKDLTTWASLKGQ